jgi:tetratricopeptide (TPR) repeat protein
MALASLLLSLLCCGCGPGEEAPAAGETPSYHIGMGKALYQRGDYTGAVRMYEKAIGMDRECAEAYLQIGTIYDNILKDKPQALFCYGKFLSLEPDSPMAEMVKEWSEEIEKNLPPSRRETLRKPSPAPPLPSIPPAPRKEKREPSPTPAPALARPASSPPARSAVPSRYTVKAGDTLARIAAAHYGDRNDWKTIFEANRGVLEKPDGIRPGMTLVIPVSPGRR